MEGEMEVVLEGEKDFYCADIDVDYEFDAPRYFELGREELPPEAQQAELWFETAGNYPPSPLLVKLCFGKKGKRENIDALFKIRDVDSFNAQMGVYALPDSSLLCGSLAGLARGTLPPQDLPNDNNCAAFDGKGSSDPCFMKPTTSKLARQNLVQRSSDRSVFQRPVPVQRRCSEDPRHSLVHAAKRQKVTGGLVRKVIGITQQCDLLHKSSKKECFVNCNSHSSKMRLTIPREPVLETARRAKNFRAHRSNHSDEKETSTSTFKALPLNRKILEAPSLSFPQKSTPKLPEFQEFKLKTSERAFLRSMVTERSLVTDNHASSSIAKDCLMGFKISEYQSSSLSKRMNDDKKERGSTQKLQSLNRNGKKFNFSTSKRSQPHNNPLSELFNKDMKATVISSEQLHEGWCAYMMKMPES